MKTSTCLTFVLLGCCWSSLVQAAIQLISAPDPSTPQSVTANGNSLAPAFSRDGRFLVFTSEASNLVTNDHNGSTLDVFVQELATGKLMLVSTTPASQSGNGNSYSPSISSNGQYVAFLSQASDLVSNDTNGLTDVFVRDLVAGTTALAAAGADGEAADGESFQPLLSADGALVCFASRASNLVPQNRSRLIDVFVRDLRRNRTSLLSASAPADSVVDRDIEEYTVSSDGHLVAFTSQATNLLLAPSGPGTATTAYLHDSSAGTTVRIFIDPVHMEPRSAAVTARSVSFSENGRFLVMQTDASSTATTSAGVYLSDLTIGTNLWIPSAPFNASLLGSPPPPPVLSADGQSMAFLLRKPGLNGYALHRWTPGRGVEVLKSPITGKTNTARALALSLDGNRLAFLSEVTDLVSPAPPGNEFQLYVLDLPSNTLRLVNTGPNGQAAGGAEYAAPQFSPDGRWLALQSRSPALAAHDRNEAEDIFLYDWDANRLSLVSAALPSSLPNSANHSSSFIARGLSVDGRYVLFASTSDDLVSGERNGLADLFVRDRVTGRTQRVNVPDDGNSLEELIVREAALSGNGRFVAFIADHHTVMAGQTQVASKVYVRDLALKRTWLANVNTNGLPGIGRPSQVGVSADGRYVIFVSTDARDLVPGLVGPVSIVVRDLKLNQALAVKPEEPRVTVPSSAPSLSGLGGKVFSITGSSLSFRGILADLTTGVREEFDLLPGSAPVMSYDGKRVAVFVSGGTQPVLRWSDLPVGDWHEVSLPSGSISFMSLSADARFAVLGLATPSPAVSEVPVLAELSSGMTSRLDLRADGQLSAGGNSTGGSLDASARTAAFRSTASDLTVGDANSFPDIFFRDLIANQTTLVSRDADGLSASDFSFLPLISANGRVVVFSSWADNLVPNDFNHAADIFAVELPGRPFSDSDSDALDDLWELSNFGNFLRDGRGDYDEDGANEAREFVAGTSPINDLSAFRATAKVESGSLVISWTTEPDRTYRLQSRDAIGTGWQPLGEGVPGDGNNISRTLPFPEAGQHFYRVVLE